MIVRTVTEVIAMKNIYIVITMVCIFVVYQLLKRKINKRR